MGIKWIIVVAQLIVINGIRWSIIHKLHKDYVLIIAKITHMRIGIEDIAKLYQLTAQQVNLRMMEITHVSHYVQRKWTSLGILPQKNVLQNVQI